MRKPERACPALKRDSLRSPTPRLPALEPACYTEQAMDSSLALGWSIPSVSRRAPPAGRVPSTSRPVRAISMTPNGRSMSTRPSILSSVPVISTISDSGATSTMRAAEDVDELHHLAARLDRRRDLDQREVTRHRGHVGDVLDLLHVDELVDVGLDARARLRAAPRRRPSCARSRTVGVTDGERVDVVAAPAQQRRDAVQHARAISNMNDKGQHWNSVNGQSESAIAMANTSAIGNADRQSGHRARWTSHRASFVLPVSLIGLGRRIIACRSAPAGTIG